MNLRDQVTKYNAPMMSGIINTILSKFNQVYKNHLSEAM